MVSKTRFPEDFFVTDCQEQVSNSNRHSDSLDYREPGTLQVTQNGSASDPYSSAQAALAPEAKLGDTREYAKHA